MLISLRSSTPCIPSFASTTNVHRAVLSFHRHHSFLPSSSPSSPPPPGRSTVTNDPQLSNAFGIATADPVSGSQLLPTYVGKVAITTLVSTVLVQSSQITE